MDISQEQLRELLDYDPETGFLTWKPRGLEMFNSERAFKSWNSRYANKRAGCETVIRRGYRLRKINIFGQSLREHRVIWVWMTGEYGPDQIDHENRDATDNRWVNMRDGSDGVNNRNLSLYKTNTSGVCGVQWNSSRGKWLVRVEANKTKYFLGRFSNKDDAESVAKEFYESNDFSEGHGT